MRIVVYTGILPHTYTTLHPPYYINKDIPYLVYSDKVIESPPWETIIISRELETPRRELQRFKMLSHKFLSEYDFAIWVDGWCRLKKDPVEIVNEVIESGKKVAFGVHPWRDCSYEEGRVCAGFKSQNREVIEAQLARYRAEGFPEHFGLAASTFFARDNKDPEVREFFELWYKETMAGSHRNQISWGYAAWKSGIDVLIWRVGWGRNEYYQKE